MQVGHHSTERALYHRKQPQGHQGWSYSRNAVTHSGFKAGSAWASQLNRSTSGAWSVIHTAVNRWPTVQCCSAILVPRGQASLMQCLGQTQDPGLLCWARAPRENKLVLCRSWSLGFADCQNLVLLTCKMLSSILVLTWDFGSWVCELPCKSRKGKPAYWQNHHSVLEQAVRGELFVVLLFLPFSMPDIYKVD